MSPFLSAQEIFELTNRKRHHAQIAALRFMGIEHRLRPDGSIAVARDHALGELGVKDTTIAKRRRVEPNWEALNA